MAYFQDMTLFRTTATRMVDASSWFFSSIESAGWVLYDTLDTSKRVYKSNGEDDDFLTGYILIDGNLSDAYMYFYAYNFWDISTHTGTGKAYIETLYEIITNHKYCFVGDKDHVFSCDYTSITGQVLFGFVPNLYFNPKATLTAISTAGTPKTLTVDDSTAFLTAKYYTLFDPSNGNIEKVYITSLPATTQITIASLTKTFSVGSVIAFAPLNLFGIGGSYNGMGLVGTQICHNDTATASEYMYVAEIEPSSMQDTVYQALSAYNVSVSFRFDCVSWAQGDYLSLSDAVFFGNFRRNSTPNLIKITNSATQEYLYVIPLDNRELGVVTSSGTGTITSNYKNWPVNQWAGKTICIIAGTGAGQVRTINSNTSDTLTLNAPFLIQPMSTTVYEIVEAAYVELNWRYSGMCFKMINYDGYRPYNLEDDI